MSCPQNFVEQLDAAEADAFGALLLLGGKCTVQFTREKMFLSKVDKAEEDTSQGSGEEYGSHEDDEDEDDEGDYDEDEDDEEEDSEEDDGTEHLASDSTDNNLLHTSATGIATGRSLTGKRKLKKSKRLRRKRRRSLTWDRGHIQDSCKEAMRRVRAYLHTQRHTPLPSYVVPISDVHSFFGLMYLNILNVGDLKLVNRFFENFATSRVTTYVYDRVKDDASKVDKAKISRMKGGDLAALYCAYFFETSPDLVSKLKCCNIHPVPLQQSPQGNHHNQAPLLPISASGASSVTEAPCSLSDSQSLTPFTLNEYICCVELDVQFQGTRLFEADIHDLKTIIERDNALTTPTQRPAWTTGRIDEYFQVGIQPMIDPISYTFDSIIRLYINNRRKVDRIEIIRSLDQGWV